MLLFIVVFLFTGPFYLLWKYSWDAILLRQVVVQFLISIFFLGIALEGSATLHAFIVIGLLLMTLAAFLRVAHVNALGWQDHIGGLIYENSVFLAVPIFIIAMFWFVAVRKTLPFSGIVIGSPKATNVDK
jgi:hypothetical protein